MKSLKKLKETDPDFYKFLEENDKNLLDFQASDESELEDEKVDKVHKPPEKLEVCEYCLFTMLNEYVCSV